MDAQTVYWGEKRYYSLDHYLRKYFGQKLYKLSLNGGIPVRTVTEHSEPTDVSSAAGEVPEISPQMRLSPSQNRLKLQKNMWQRNIPVLPTSRISRHIQIHMPLLKI